MLNQNVGELFKPILGYYEIWDVIKTIDYTPKPHISFQIINDEGNMNQLIARNEAVYKSFKRNKSH